MPDKPSEDFTQLRSDIKLRESLAALECENPSDRTAIDFVLNQKALTKIQRIWANGIIARSGKKFVFVEGVRPGQTDFANSSK